MASLIKNWVENLRIVQVDAPFPASGKVHLGFLQAHQALSAPLFSELSNQLETYSNYNIVIVGHSLGGAQATLMAMDLFYNRKIQKNLYVITLGSPRVGNSEFAKSFQKLIEKSFLKFKSKLEL